MLLCAVSLLLLLLLLLLLCCCFNSTQTATLLPRQRRHIDDSAQVDTTTSLQLTDCRSTATAPQIDCCFCSCIVMGKSKKSITKRITASTDAILAEKVNYDLAHATNDHAQQLSNNQLFAIDTDGSSKSTKAVKRKQAELRSVEESTRKVQHNKAGVKAHKKAVVQQQQQQQKIIRDELIDQWNKPIDLIGDGFRRSYDANGHVNGIHTVHRHVRTDREKAALTRDVKISHTIIDDIHSGSSFNPAAAARSELIDYATVLHEKSLAMHERLETIKSGEHLTTTYDIEPVAFEQQVLEDEAAAAANDDWMNSDQPQSKKQKRSKTKQEHRKHQELLQREKQLLVKKQQNRFAKSLEALPFVIADIQREERIRADVNDSKATVAAQLDRHPKLGNRLFIPTFPRIPLTEDLEQNNSTRAEADASNGSIGHGRALRNIKPAIGIVKDQLERYESRHMIEPFRRFDDKVWVGKRKRDKHMLRNRKLNVLPADMQ